MAAANIPLETVDIKARIQKLYSVSQEEEEQLMIRYTKIYTRELVFAVDMMSFVLQENCMKFQNFIYPNCLGSPCPSDFDDVMGTFVSLTLKKYTKTAQEMLETNVDLVQPNYSEFKAHANSVAFSSESSLNYSGYAFLVFCVVTAEMCSLAYMFGISKAPDFGIMLICRVHSNFELKGLLPANAWQVLKDAASNGIVMRTLEELKTLNESETKL